MSLRLAFMGSPEFAVPALKQLVDAGHQVVRVYAQPPRPAGRGYETTPCAVHAYAEGRGLTVATPKTLRDAQVQADFAALDLDAAIVCAYGMLLPAEILEAPRQGCLNIHASLLPRWRGAAPIQRAILAGDRETGITIMQMEAGLDTGPMLLREVVPILPDMTAGQLHDELAQAGARALDRALEGLAEGTLTPEPQPAEGVTYAAKLSRDEARLDFNKPAAELARAVRAFDPWPAAWFTLAGERIKVFGPEVVDATGTPATVIDDHLTIACGQGALRPRRIQRPGRILMDADSALLGWPVPVGTRVNEEDGE